MSVPKSFQMLCKSWVVHTCSTFCFLLLQIKFEHSYIVFLGIFLISRYSFITISSAVSYRTFVAFQVRLVVSAEAPLDRLFHLTVDVEDGLDLSDSQRVLMDEMEIKEHMVCLNSDVLALHALCYKLFSNVLGERSCKCLLRRG